MSDLLDREMPRWHFRERHALAIDAAPGAIWRAVHDVRPDQVRFMRELFWLRGLPARLTGRHVASGGGAESLLEIAKGGGFVLLAEQPEREVVLGTIGRFWELNTRPLRFADATAFRAFADPSYARAAITFRLEKSCLYTETRIVIDDRVAHRRFALYWLFVRPGSALLRRTWLQAIARQARA